MNEAEADYHILMHRPGFLIRRLHQIHLSLFAEECADFGLTPVQYSIMTAIADRPRQDQMRLCEAAAIDRATMADVLARLEARGLVTRRRSEVDQRMKLVSLSASGRRLLTRIDPHAQRAHERTVAALSPAERSAFIESLTRLIAANPAIEATPVPVARPRAARRG